MIIEIKSRFRIDYHDYYNYIIKTFQQQQQQFDDNLLIQITIKPFFLIWV